MKSTKLLVALLSFFIATSFALGWWIYQKPSTSSETAGVTEMLGNEEVKDRVVQELVARGDGSWDTHPDSDVVRVMLPWANKEYKNADLRSNSYGFRERQFAIPKPDGLVRVVLLGDSFIFGMGCPSEERLGVHLERWLTERAGPDAPPIEVLHLGIPSWGLVNQATYMRRSLGLIQPDAVLMYTTLNDLDDTASVRGFGTLANFDHTHPNRGENLIGSQYGPRNLDPSGPENYLLTGLEFEGQARYAAACAASVKLRDACLREGSSFLILSNWHKLNAVLQRAFGDHFEKREFAFISKAFAIDARYRIAPDDNHWSVEGMILMAKYAYGAILERGLLPNYPVGDWDEALEVFRSIQAEAEDYRILENTGARYRRGLPIDHVFRATEAKGREIAHVMSGVQGDGTVGPYALVTLYAQAPRQLRVVGQGLKRSELEGMQLTISAHGQALGTIRVAPGEPFEETLELPPAVQNEDDLYTIEIAASDYCYRGTSLRNCVSYRLELIELLP